MARTPVLSEELQLDVQAYYDNGGNKSDAARSRGLSRQTYNDHLRMAQNRLGISLGKVAAGRLKALKAKELKLPRRGHIKRYILTSVQNNTHLHPGFNNLLAYVDWLDDLDRATCKLMIGTYSYDVNSYGAKAVKRGKTKEREELWYSPEAEPFIVDESVQLAPGLVWCGEQNILPTNKHPLSDFEDYNGRSSNIVPHAKVAMESVASMADEATKFNYSTGTVTQMNYIQKRVGILAERKHDYGAALVEVDHNGNWWVRQLHIDDDDAIMDVGPRGYRGVYVQTGTVYTKPVAANIYWGDGHASEMDLWVRELAWGEGGMLDTLHPPYQFMGDVFSMNSRGHHEIKDFHQSYRKHVACLETVEDEVQLTSDFVNEAYRDWCETVIVPSNHHRHLDRWLNEADFRRDPVNAKYFLQLQWHVLEAIDNGEQDFSILEWAMRDGGLVDGVRFLAEDESFIVAGVENGLHGDLGPNGSRGSTINLTKLGRRVNKGHDHQARIRGHVYSAGVCSLSFNYTKGPSSHSVSHIVTYENGERAIITMWADRWRA